MTLPAQHKGDWKLLLAIGGCVVAGAVLIAIVAGTRASQEAAEASREAGRPRAEVATSSTESAPETAGVMNASRKMPGGPALGSEPKIPGSTIGPEFAGEAGSLPGAPVEERCPAEDEAGFARAGHAAYGTRDYHVAAACWKAETASRPERAYGHYMLGLSLWKAGELERAAEALRRSAELNPGSLRTFLNLSRVLNQRGEFEAALAAAESARSLDPEHPQAFYVQARSLRNLGRVEDAVVALEQALAFDAEYGHALNLLGLIRIHQGRFAEAAGSLQLAARYEPELPYIHANLGRALELEGRPGEAVLAFRAALDLDPELRSARVSLARVEEAAASAGTDEDVVEAVAAVSDDGGEPAPQAETGGTLQ
jgi:tetratricopeptide (TPR) repeat protein